MAGGGGAGTEYELEDIVGKFPLKINRKVFCRGKKAI